MHSHTLERALTPTHSPTRFAGKLKHAKRGEWRDLKGALVNVSVGADGTCWGTNAANEVFRKVG